MATHILTTPTTRRTLFGRATALAITAAGVDRAAAGPPHPDAVLIAACDRFMFLEAEYGRLCKATDWPTGTPQTSEMDALEQELTRVGDEHHTVGDWLAEQTPSTPEGAKARARAAVAYLRGDIRHDMISRLQYAIMLDLAGEV